jgi:hypothetical protein
VHAATMDKMAKPARSAGYRCSATTAVFQKDHLTRTSRLRAKLLKVESERSRRR